MTPSRPSLLARFLQLKPAMRFVVVGVAILAGYFFLDDYCWSYARSWTAEANRLQALLERGALRGGPLRKDVERAAIAFGSVEIPESEAQTSETLALAVNDTMKKHRISLYGYEALSGGKLPNSAMTSLAGAGGRIERMRADVKFEAPADEVGQIVTDFEENPSIDAVNSIKLRWLESHKKVDVRISTEAWAIAGRESRKRGGS